MKYNIKGLGICGLIITSKHQLENCVVSMMEGKEIFDLFIKAINEGKITFENKTKEKKDEIR